MIKEKLKGLFLLFLAVVLMALGTAIPAKAVDYPYPVVTQYRAEYRYDPKFTGSYQTSLISACDEFASLWMTVVAKGQTWLVTSCMPGDSPRVYIQQKGNTNNTFNSGIWVYTRCPYGGIKSGNQCIKNPDEKPECVAGTKINVTYKLINASGVQIYSPSVDGSSDGDCRIKLVDVKQCYLGVDGASYCQYVGERTGDLLATSATYPPPSVDVSPAPGDDSRIPANAGTVKNGGACPKGTVAGGFSSDGLINCIGTGSAPRNQPPAPPITKTETKTANADGSNTNTITTVKTNSDGSKTTIVERIVVMPSGETRRDETRDTSPRPDGNPGKETPEKPAEQKDFCKQNPGLSVCRESSVSGKCGEISCTGDAIQCANLRAVAVMECRDADDRSQLDKMAVRGTGQAILEGADPQQGAIDAMLKGDKVDLSKPNIDQSGFLGGGSCFAPKSFSVSGRTVTMDFDVVCNNIQPLRAVVLACAFIIAYLIVSKSVLEAA